jgi:MoxR-like ATPase
MNPSRITAQPRTPSLGWVDRAARAAGKKHLGKGRLMAVRSDQAQVVEDSRTVQVISDVMNAVERDFQDIAAGITDRISSGLGSSEGHEDFSSLRTKVSKSITRLQIGLLERDMEVRLMLLAALCGEHLLLLGPPGTAKSELSRRLSSLTGGEYFERLLTRFSVPEELFGPLSIKGLERDEYNRKTEGYLPTAEVAFIDEIFKANSAILNALLTLLNERLFDNGTDRLPVPLLCLVGASNELPESEELDALYDRFLIRKEVNQVSKSQLGELARLAATRNGSDGQGDDGQGDPLAAYAQVPDLSLDEFKRTEDEAIRHVDISDEIIDVLTELRNYLQDKCEPPIYVSDRRFMKAVNMMQVAAFADNREQVSEADCLLLEYVMGNKPEDSQKVRSKVLEILASDLGMQQCELLFLGLFGRACGALDNGDKTDAEALLNDCTSLNEILASRLENVREALELDFPQLRSSIWLSDSNASSAVQFLSPQMEENKSKLEDMVRETLILQRALASNIPGGMLEKLLPKRFKQYQKGVADRA